MIYLINTVKDKNNVFRIQNIINQETGEILSLVDFLCKGHGTVFVNNLSLAFMEISKALLKLKYRNVFHAEKNNQFSFVYSHGDCLQIRIHKGNKIFNIVNFEKKFLQDFKDFETNKLLVDYAIQNERNSTSLGNDAFNEFIHMCFKTKGHKLNINACREIFRRDYPLIKDSMLEQAKLLTSGYQYSIPGLYNNIYYYDIVSSFSSQLLNSTPKGAPKEFEKLEDIPESYFYIIKATFFKIKIKPGKIDFLTANGKNVKTFVMTQHLFELFQRNYEFTTYKIKRLLGFKTIANRFNEFLYKNIINGKINNDCKPIIKYNKAIANSLVGYFGKNTISTQSKIKRHDGLISIVTTDIKKPPIYLPLYLYVTGKAKSEFIEQVQALGDKIIYANTDGFLSSQKISLQYLNRRRQSVIGSYSEKPMFKKIFIECVNGYCGLASDGTLDNTISGMRLPDKITVEQYQSKEFKYVINSVNEHGEIQEFEIEHSNN